MQKRILYVEDNPRNMLLLKRIMLAEGFLFLEATDGEMGWRTAVRERPDLILMDISLPGELSGLALTRRLKRHPHLQNIPIIVLTAYNSLAVEEAAKAAGCSGFLTKPANIKQLRATIYQQLQTAVVHQLSQQQFNGIY